VSSLRKPAFVYTVGRLGLFVLVALLLRSGAGLVGTSLNGLPLLLAALLVSSLISLFLLAGPRQQLAEALASQRSTKTAELAARRARLEDDGGQA